MSEDHDAAVAEAARAQADARRKRIMEKANKRLNLVSGETAVADEDKEASQSNAARIRAARQRRYKKKVVSETSEEGKEDTPEKVQAVSEVSKDISAAVDEAPSKLAETDKGTDSNSNNNETGNDGTTQSKETEAKESDKKKYLGVAKMRRKKMLERKKSGSESIASMTSDASRSAAAAPSKKPSMPVYRLPIYMHVFTVLLLFFAGLDVGVQVFKDDVTISSQHVLRQHGLPIIHRQMSKTKPKAELNSESLNVDQNGEDLLDEFGDEDVIDRIPNIDPLFGVDLDDFTKGPGLLNHLARVAIEIHRLNLRVFYYTPGRFLKVVLSLPTALINTPPVLCVVALILRQLVGKTILGAAIPVSEENEKKKEGGIDLVAMGKSAVTNFMSTTFPTAIAMYGAFTDLRSDMYIVMCGVFCGLAWTHTLGASLVLHASTTGTDEL